VLLNSIARRIIDAQRGKHPEYVFTYEGRPVTRMLNTSFKKARKRAGLPHLRAHDLRHTVGHRLRAMGVSREDRKAILGHKDDDVTTRYSAADLARLLDVLRKLEDPPRTTMLRVVAQNGHNLERNPRRSADRVVSV
jgi:integrase